MEMGIHGGTRIMLFTSFNVIKDLLSIDFFHIVLF